MEQPICLFGPGEGYYRPWPGKDYQPGQSLRSIRKALRKLGAMFRIQQKRDNRVPGLAAELPQGPEIIKRSGLGYTAGKRHFSIEPTIWEVSYECNTKANGYPARTFASSPNH